MINITDRHGNVVDSAETMHAAMRLVDYYQRTNHGNGPYTAVPVHVAVTVTTATKRKGLVDRFLDYFSA